jgi:hypothetical protein
LTVKFAVVAIRFVETLMFFTLSVARVLLKVKFEFAHAAYTTNVANTTANVNIICGQLQTQDTNLTLAGVSFANLVPGLQPWSLVYNLASTGLEVVEGGPAYVLQSIANTNTQGGQAIVSTMREARNQERLSIAGMQTDITISDQYPEPRADFGTTQYTVAQATDQKII